MPMPRKDPPPVSKTAEALSAALPLAPPVNALPGSWEGEGLPEGVGEASGAAEGVGAEAVPARLGVLAEE